MGWGWWVSTSDILEVVQAEGGQVVGMAAWTGATAMRRPRNGSGRLSLQQVWTLSVLGLQAAASWRG